MRSSLLLYTIVIILALGSYVAYQFVTSTLVPGTGSILISASPSAQVFLNGTSMGASTYQNPHIKSGEYTVKLVSQSSTQSAKKEWETKLVIHPETQFILKREFSPLGTVSAGEQISLEKGSGMTLISDPAGASLSIDNQPAGVTPYSGTLNPGIHTFTVSKERYTSRDLKLDITNGLKIITRVDLAAQIEIATKNLPDYNGFKIVHMYPSDSSLLLDLPSWSTQLSVQERGVDFFLGYDGTLFPNKETVATLVKEKSSRSIGYLAEKSANQISEEAKKTLGTLKKDSSTLGTQTSIISIKVSSTPTGFLNVRDNPSTTGKIITKIKPGERYIMLEENTEWFKIKLSESRSGWISKQYAQKSS